MNQQTSDKCWSQNELRLSNTLRRLWFEHVVWTRSFIVRTASSLKDLDAVTKRLLRNPIDFAYALAPFYGTQISMRFESLLRDHLLIAAQLVNAAKAGDKKAVEEQRRKWHANADEIAVLLGDINPNWSKHEWQKMMYEHLQMTENEAVQILTGNYASSIEQFDSIQKQALEMGNYMASGIIQQFCI